MADTLYDNGYATLPDETEMWRGTKAAKREALIVTTTPERELYRYNPNAARRNDRPGIPLDGYGMAIIGAD